MDFVEQFFVVSDKVDFNKKLIISILCFICL